MSSSSAPPSEHAPDRWLSWPAAFAILAVLCSPFLWVDVPPLVDVPGHIGAAAIAAAPPGSPLDQYYDWQWAFVPNLSGEVLIKLLGPLTGIQAAGWWAMLIATACFALGGMSIIRALNPRGAHGAGLALLFVFGFPWLWGFINFVLAAGLAMLAFAFSLHLQRAPSGRAAFLIVAQPVLMMCHALGGLLLPVLVAAEAMGTVLDGPKQGLGAISKRLFRECWPLAASVLFVALWKANSAPVAGPALAWEFLGKLDFLMEVLRDQSFVFDVASVIVCYLLVLTGRLLGARWTWRQAMPPLAVLLLYALLPARINGSELVDIRFLPVVMLLALGLQDWSQAAPAIKRAVVLIGLLLLAARLAAITVSFHTYAASYQSELRALDQVRPGSRIAVLRRQSCANVEWRMSRLDTLPALASLKKQAWINSQWAIPGIHMAQERFNPAPGNPDALNAMIWEPDCPDGDGRTLDQALTALPLENLDYVWLLDTGIPGKQSHELRPLWQENRSAIFRVKR